MGSRLCKECYLQNQWPTGPNHAQHRFHVDFRGVLITPWMQMRQLLLLQRVGVLWRGVSLGHCRSLQDTIHC